MSQHTDHLAAYLGALPSHERALFLKRFSNLPHWAFGRFRKIYNKKHRALINENEELAQEVLVDERAFANDIVAELRRRTAV